MARRSWHQAISQLCRWFKASSACQVGWSTINAEEMGSKGRQMKTPDKENTATYILPQIWLQMSIGDLKMYFKDVWRERKNNEYGLISPTKLAAEMLYLSSWHYESLHSGKQLTDVKRWKGTLIVLIVAFCLKMDAKTKVYFTWKAAVSFLPLKWYWLLLNYPYHYRQPFPQQVFR